MAHVVFVAELRHFLQYVFINWRCELSPYGFSQLPVSTVEESLQTIPSPRPPKPLSLVVLRNILSRQSIFSPFSMPQSTASGNMPLMSVSHPLSPGPFSPSQAELLLSPSLVPAFMSANIHFISALFDGFKTVITNPVSPTLMF